MIVVSQIIIMTHLDFFCLLDVVELGSLFRKVQYFVVFILKVHGPMH